MAQKPKPPLAKPLSSHREQLLERRLKEAEDTLQAIREGAVDALIVETGEGEQVFTLKSADYPYRLIIDNMVQGAVIFNEAGIVFYANTTFASMVNHSHEELYAISVDTFISEEDRELFKTMASSRSQIAGGAGTIHLRCKDRHDLAVYVGLVPLNIDDQDLYCAILTDLTEQKKYDRALAEEKFSRMVLEQTGEAVIVCDRSGRIIRHSRVTERLISGVLHAQFNEKFHLTFPGAVAVSGEDQPWDAGRKVVEEVLGGKTFHGLEVDLQLGRTALPLILSARPLQDDEGNTIGAIITMVDISARKKAERDMQVLNDSLEQRIVARTQDLLSYQKHLRDMTSELVVTEQRERRRLANELHDYLAQLLVVCRMKLAPLSTGAGSPAVKSGLEDIDTILSDSLTYTRTLIAELSPNILYELGIVPALVWLGEQFERHDLHVLIQKEEEHIPLPEDHAIFVYQAIRELLFNIKKHADTNQATISLTRTAFRELQVQVEDAGKGFHLTEKSHDYTRPGKFGLFSIRERLEALGGSIHIESKIGEGTCITLRVPFSPSLPDGPQVHTDPVSPSPPSFSKKAVRGEGIRILLVDDHALVRQGIRGLLEVHADFRVVGEAQDGLEAIEYTRTLHPDIIVMDVNMPKLNGIEATRKIIREWPEVLIFALSVQEDEHVQKMMLEAGAVRFLTKNGVATDLVDGIRELISSSK